MKKLLLMLDLFLTGLLVFALLMPMPARADTLPKKFLGEWCQLPGSLRDENGKYLVMLLTETLTVRTYLVQ